MSFLNHNFVLGKSKNLRLEKAKRQCIDFFNRHSTSLLETKSTHPGDNQEYREAVNKLDNIARKRAVYQRIADRCKIQFGNTYSW